MGSSTTSPRRIFSVLTAAMSLSQLVAGIQLTPTDQNSAKQAAQTMAQDGWSFYTGYRPGDVPGNLPAPTYWWEAGAFMMTFVDYWYYTGDEQYNANVSQALLHQTGSDNNYITPNQSSTEGNDDQGFWGMAALEAAELGFPDPPEGSPQWLALAQGVFNSQVPRWGLGGCNGGLKWQIYSFKQGWDYKNSVSNGVFFSMAARLYRYTGNQTFADWAERTWDWTMGVGLMTPDYQIWDGTDDTQNCTQVSHVQWTYEYGLYLHGAASMWNATSDQKWKTHVDGLVSQSQKQFVKNGVLFELTCTPNCATNHDAPSFLSYFIRWAAVTTQLCPWTAGTINSFLQSSASAAATSCTGQPADAPGMPGVPNTYCGQDWTKGSFDGNSGVGQQMTGMQIMGSLLVGGRPAPFTLKSGGTSKGDNNAGTGASANPDPGTTEPITTSDRAGAGILSILVVGIILGGAVWMVL